MKLVNQTLGTIRTNFLRALVAASVILLVAAIYVHKKHRDAENFLAQVDLHARNTSGASFYASKKRLFVGQNQTRADIVEHLKSINFVESERPGQPGSYLATENDTLSIVPRLPEFQPVTIEFRHNHIIRISVEPTALNPSYGEMAETTVEPAPLGAFVMSIDGDEHSKMFVRRYTVQFDDFKDTPLFDAILGSEDTRFMSHNGNRFDRMLINLMPGYRGGGSSITTQVIKNVISLDRTRAVTRKIDEVFLASTLEQEMSKQDILTLYVNDVFLGGGKGSPNVYGFLAAAEEYFGKKSIQELTLSETCTLVALLPQPDIFLNQSRSSDYRKLTEWRDRVLARLNYNWPKKYPAAMIEAARTEQVHFVAKPYVEQPLDVLSRPFIDYAAKQQPLIDLENLPPTEYSGLHLFTSIDPELMREAQRILNNFIPDIERRFPPVRGGGCEGRDDRMLGAIVALNPQTGEVISMSGGAGGNDGVKYAKFALNAMDAPASTIKPFWLAQALAEARLPNGERFTAASNIDPTNASLSGWQPDIGLHGAGRARARLAVSADDYFVYLLGRLGLDEGKKFFQNVTGNTVSNPTGELAVGFGRDTEVSPLRWARALTIFPNGALMEPNPISQVYLDGKELSNKRKPSRPVIDSSAAYIATQMMRSVLGYGPDGLHGTARQAFARTGLRLDKIEMGGKTGSGPSSVWMVSVSPKLVITVLLTYQCHSEIRNAQDMYSRDTAALVWAEFVKSIHKYRPDLLTGTFTRPANVSQYSIDPKRGCLSPNTASIDEFFIKGTEPRPCGSGGPVATVSH
ncbi:MAG TPA: hypothetical protein DC047_06635 [Blastocatellia bacterium]|nr:hypothetical protein [Blastocatellia bacterium]